MKNLLSFPLACVFTFTLFIAGCDQAEKATDSAVNNTLQKETSEKAQLSLDLGFELQSIFEAHPETIGMLLCVEGTENAMVAVGKQQKSGMAMSPNQIVLIASNTKTYVSSAVLRLTELYDLKITTPIGKIISKKSAESLSKRGYNLDEITVAHLLSHTSGIRDYATSEQYFEMIKANPKHRWSRDEQIEMAMQLGDPLGAPEWGFSYADVNFLLATEIIEHYTQKEFFTAMRELLKYEELGLNSTWFYTLEAVPSGAEELAYQYWTSEGLDNHIVDPSFDLFGGGGIAATTRDMARFTHALFNGKVFDKPETLELLKTKMPIDQGEDPKYFLGLSEGETGGYQSYGHGGFWVTSSMYFPELESTIAVAVMDRDAKNVRKDVFEMTVSMLTKEDHETK